MFLHQSLTEFCAKSLNNPVFLNRSDAETYISTDVIGRKSKMCCFLMETKQNIHRF